jgi:serine/threonine-protein kinase
VGNLRPTETNELSTTSWSERLWSRTLTDLVTIDPLIGAILAERFEIQALIGTGACSRVYKARQLPSDNIVALKLLHTHLVSDAESVARFKREAESGASLDHGNICTIYEYGHVNTGQPYIAMEYLSGESLASVLRQNDGMPMREALPIFIACCRALKAAHDNGIVHRDIKPANIFLLGSGANRTVKLLDFGLAKLVAASKPNLTQSGMALGTVQYMSPEQLLSSPIDARSDIYSLACVMYETLTGSKPYPGKTFFELMEQHLKAAPAPFPQTERKPKICADLQASIMRALEKDPDRRYQSVDELRLILEQILRREMGKENFARSVPRLRALALASLIFALILMCVCSTGPAREDRIPLGQVENSAVTR